MNRIKMVVAIFMLCAAVAPVYLLILLLRHYRFKKSAIRTSATIISTQPFEAGMAHQKFIYQLEYTVKATGQNHMATHYAATDAEQGTCIPLYYLPNNPLKYATEQSKPLMKKFSLALLFLFLISWFCYRLLQLDWE